MRDFQATIRKQQQVVLLQQQQLLAVQQRNQVLLKLVCALSKKLAGISTSTDAHNSSSTNAGTPSHHILSSPKNPMPTNGCHHEVAACHPGSGQLFASNPTAHMSNHVVTTSQTATTVAATAAHASGRAVDRDWAALSDQEIQQALQQALLQQLVVAEPATSASVLVAAGSPSHEQYSQQNACHTATSAAAAAGQAIVPFTHAAAAAAAVSTANMQLDRSGSSVYPIGHHQHQQQYQVQYIPYTGYLQPSYCSSPQQVIPVADNLPVIASFDSRDSTIPVQHLAPQVLCFDDSSSSSQHWSANIGSAALMSQTSMAAAPSTTVAAGALAAGTGAAVTGMLASSGPVCEAAFVQPDDNFGDLMGLLECLDADDFE